MVLIPLAQFSLVLRLDELVTRTVPCGLWILYDSLDPSFRSELVDLGGVTTEFQQNRERWLPNSQALFKLIKHTQTHPNTLTEQQSVDTKYSSMPCNSWLLLELALTHCRKETVTLIQP